MMKKLTLMGVTVGVCLFCSAQLQPIKPLIVGDTVPDIVFRKVINYKDSVVRLSDFPDKLIILDFWATTCMSCIYHMPECDSLQNQFSDQMQILLVNPRISGDNIKRVQSRLSLLKKRTGHDVRLPIIMYDDHAFALFPFQYLPHYVWIGRDRVVRAITGAEGFTSVNIELLLAGKKLNLPVKTY